MIEEQAKRAGRGQPGRVVMKLNNLVDEAVIEALYRASSAGVPIDLVTRSICALRPGVPGLSDSIRVRSIVGRFLEHSRIYQFGVEPDDEIWIGSADLMHRNLDRRVEALIRVDAAGARARLQMALDLALADTEGAWELQPDGRWEPHPPSRRRVSSQEALMERAGRPTILRLPQHTQ
jgi:polyphosphate kinase